MAQTLAQQPPRPLLHRSPHARAGFEASARYRSSALPQDPETFLCHRRGAALALQRPAKPQVQSGWMQVTILVGMYDHAPLRFRLACEGTGMSRLTRPVVLSPNWRHKRAYCGAVYVPKGTQVLLLFVDLPHDSRLRLAAVRLSPITSGRALVQTGWAALRQQPLSIARLQRAGERLFGALLQGGISGTAREMLPWGGGVATVGDYRAWIEEYERLLPQDEARILATIQALPQPPRFSIVMPTYNSRSSLLRQAVASVQQQKYPHWELCIADDASTDKGTQATLAELAEADPRIRLKMRRSNGHISLASNSALALARYEWVVLLDHDDRLSPLALFYAAMEVATHPQTQVIYSDEDKMDMHDNRMGPYFKPDFDPDLLHGQNMFSHLGIYRTELMRRLGGFRRGYEGSQDHDLALRATEQLRPDQIRHIPHILYHWRLSPESASNDCEAKPYARINGAKAVRDQLARLGVKARVHIDAETGVYRVTYPLPEVLPTVTVVIPTRDQGKLLRQCIDSLRTITDYAAIDLVVVNNQSSEAETLEYFNELRSTGAARIVDYPKAFNFSAVCNLGAAQAQGSADDGLLLFLNNDVEIFQGDWLKAMVRQALRSDVGVVGAKLIYPDGRVQHAGVICGIGGIAAHAHVDFEMNSRGYFDRNIIAHQYSAVTGACLMMRRQTFAQLGGFDEDFPTAYNDLDLCLRTRAAGLKVMFEPQAILIHHESVSRGSDLTGANRKRLAGDAEKFYARYRAVVEADPCYNPNLTLYSGSFTVDTPRHAGYRIEANQ